MSVTERGRPVAATSSDAELMLQVQDNDAGAFEQLYDRHCARAYRIATEICRRPGAAEDAVQEAFISMWRSRMSYRPGLGEVAAWAMTVVRNRAIDVSRRDARHDERRGDAEPLERESAAVNISADAIAADDAQRLRERLAALPATQREVITLAFYGELSHSEIAAHLELPAGTVKGRMRLGLEQLRAFH